MKKIIQNTALVENETIEFKTSFNDEVIISLVAFANTKGGSVFIGISDSGEVIGLQLGKETIAQWINEVKNKTASTVIPDVELISYDGKQVVVFKIQEYPIKPISFKGKCYKRVESSNHLMSVEEIANEHLKTINTSWDFYLDPNHNLDTISLDKVARFIKKIEQRTLNTIQHKPLEFLQKMEMIREGKLTFGAYLLFVSDYCAISDIQIGRFKSDITIIDSLSLNTDLFSEVDEIMLFIKKHLKVEYIITGEPQRTERFDYPLDAIREVVINMIVHRDYRDSSGSVIKIFDNRIEFYNPGKLFGGITLQNLLSGNYTSKSRNKLIAKAFKEVGLIERYGSGIQRIHNICKDFGIVPPIFEEETNGIKVVLSNKKLNDGLNGGLNGGLNEELEKIYLIIKETPGIKIKDIIPLTENSSTRTIERYIAELIELQLVERKGSRKTGGYFITNKGYDSPIFEEETNGIKVVLSNKKLNGGLNDGLNGGLNDGLNGGLNEELEKIYLIIQETPGIQVKDIIPLTENSSTRTIERYIAELIELQLVERKGSRKTGGYFIVEKNE